jgi:uncharacterized protein DUF4389
VSAPPANDDARAGSGGHAYPARLTGSLEPGLSRGLWLIKWLLALPHIVILVFLWIAFSFLSVIAWFAILFTGRYPRGLFDFNVGVLRWTWRVAYYAFEVLGTDRYPPFSLEDDPGYPARLEIDYPERLSRGLVLVKSWLLAIPQLVVVGAMTGATFGGSEVARRHGYGASGIPLIGVLVLIAAVALLFTGTYPEGIFRFVMGLHRWGLRVAAYVGLFRDEYPPFRLDMGGDDPGSPAATAPPAPGADEAASW